MNAFPWARRPAPSRTVQLPEDQPLYLISDVHLGDGTRSDAFVGKDRELLEFLHMVRREGAHLVIAGDIIDFSQALTFTRVLRAHGDVLRCLSEMAGLGGVTYVWGNHDYDMALYRDLLRWDVCSSVELGSDILLVHGHQFDPYIANNLRESGVTTTIHHQVERALGTWLRTPLEEFYTVAGRLMWWVCRRLSQALRVFFRLLERLGLPPQGAKLEAYLNYWVQTQVGNPLNLWPQVREHLLASERHTLVCGHSHLPGKVQLTPDRTFINSGSWTFRAAQYVHWDGEQFHVRDWASDAVIGDEHYRPLLEGRLTQVDFDRWWREEYLGWLRFRCGETRRRGLDIRPWYLEDGDSPPAPQGDAA